MNPDLIPKEPYVRYDENVLFMLKDDGFCFLFQAYHRNFKMKGCKNAVANKKAYNQAEKIFQAHFQTRKYKSYDSFRQIYKRFKNKNGNNVSKS